MLAAKLQEMEEKEDEEVMDENIYEAEEEEVEAEEGEEGAEEEAGEEGEEEELEIEDMSVEDLKDLIRDIVAQETGNEDEMEAGEEGPEGQEDMVSMDDSEEIDINELLAELEGMDDEMEEGITDTVKNVANKVGKGLEKGIDYVGNKLHGGKGLGLSRGETVNEEENLDESIVGDVAATLDTTMQQAEFIIGVLGALGVVGASAVLSKVQDMAKSGKFGKAIQTGAGKLEKLGATAAGVAQQRESAEVQEDLNEALKAVKILRNQLQEVNLLNAKLLYVNKVFKSNNLSEGQKVNVIAAFDKAETVKEVKLVFETVSKNVVAKPAAIKEHRSFASKATGNAKTTAPKEIISEVSEQVARWQKLAGIIKS
jgi:hypothetical protein